MRSLLYVEFKWNKDNIEIWIDMDIYSSNVQGWQHFWKKSLLLIKGAIECIDQIFYIVLWYLHRRYVA